MHREAYLRGLICVQSNTIVKEKVGLSAGGL